MRVKLVLFLGLLVLMLAVPTHAEVRNLYIAATDGFAYLPSDNTVEGQSAERKYYIRGFCDDVDGTMATPGCAMLPAPIIDVTQGDDIFLHLRNIDNANPTAPKDPHTIHLHGMHVTSQNDGFPETSWEVPECGGGSTSCATNVGTYYFKAESPGTYMWHCHVEASEHVQMGMYGALIIRPAMETLSTVYGGTFRDRFDREYIILLSDVETAAHDAIQSDFHAAALPVIYPDTSAEAIDNYNFAEFTANAWIVNGRAFPDTIAAVSTGVVDEACATDATRTVDMSIDFEGCNPEFSGPPSGFLTGSNNFASYDTFYQANLNERILFRVINLGYDSVPWHIHGWHFTIVGKDARPWKNQKQETAFTLNIGSGETYDLIVFADDRTDIGQYATASNFYAAPNEMAQFLGSCPGGKPCTESMNGVTDDYWFPMHSHDDFKVTNFGEYPGGQLAIMHIGVGLLP
jgi:FtsP/CotA-like multicopper oxidase with cupredoxin domain